MAAYLAEVDGAEPVLQGPALEVFVPCLLLVARLLESVACPAVVEVMWLTRRSRSRTRRSTQRKSQSQRAQAAVRTSPLSDELLLAPGQLDGQAPQHVDGGLLGLELLERALKLLTPQDAFEMFDEDGSGKLDEDEYLAMLHKEREEKKKEKQAKEREAAANGDAEVTLGTVASP